MSTFTRGVWGYPRRSLAALTALLVGLSWLVLGAPPAGADGPTTFSNTDAISIPAVGSVDQKGPASPYPSTISVTGMAGLVTQVTVTFTNLSHGSVGDIDAMVVAPSGQNILVLSDVGDPSPVDLTGQLVTASGINLTFSDAAAGPVPRVYVLPGGTYRPSNTDVGDVFPSAAPAPSSNTTLAGAFTGISPNGDWKLYAVDDVSGETGVMAGGWSLAITTETASVATTTAVTTSNTTSTTGSPVTLTAAVATGGVPVTSGSVQFSDGGTNLGAPVALGLTGNASLTTSSLSEGTHQIVATYSGAAGFLSSNGMITQRVDNQTVVTGNTFCNTGQLVVPGVGPAQPYPSNINVSGMSGTITKVTASIKGLTHAALFDLDVLLAGPDQSTNLFLMSDSGGGGAASGVNLTFDDAAASVVPAPLISGTYRPTNQGSGSDALPAPAPAPSSATALSTFNGASANGQWSLWVGDDASGDAGSISGGWCLTVTTEIAQAATTTVLSVSPNPSTFGTDVTLTAIVTAGGSPVASGTVQFSDGATLLGAPLAVGANGKATLTTSSLGAGSHALTATYSGTPTFAASSGAVAQVVAKAPTATTLAVVPNPSTAGSPVTLTATVTVGGAAVTAGGVQFSDGATLLGAPVSVGASGIAALTTSSLAVGTHTILATYSGNGSYGSSGSVGVLQTVNPLANAGGPYTVTEGGALTLNASGSTPGLTYSWDVNGDGVFGDAMGVSPTLSWVQLEALGIDDGPATHDVRVQVVAGASSFNSASVVVPVANTAPTAALTGAPTATVGVPLTVQTDAKDPSSADMAAPFTYTIDWGDGSAVETMSGPADSQATHTYTSPGARNISLTATDKDGAASGPATISVTVGVAPSPSPTVTPPSGQTDLYSTPGYHFLNGRRWFTTCEPYSQTVRCQTSIWATQVTYTKGAYQQTRGWFFNNLTYLPFMTRAQWANNPLGHTGQWTAVDGRRWRTACDTPLTGGNGCRSEIWVNYIAAKVDARGNRTYHWTSGWVFNNIVRFR